MNTAEVETHICLSLASRLTSWDGTIEDNMMELVLGLPVPGITLPGGKGGKTTGHYWTTHSGMELKGAG